MDGREHPSDLAPHTWAGFSTGHWERNMLVVETTHIKTGWLLRNGAPTSDLATMTEYYTRYGNYLMLASFVNDPVYLDEPFIRTSNFVLSLTTNADAWGNCGPAQIIDELGGRPKGWVPHYLPGQTAHIQEFLDQERRSGGGRAGRSRDHISRIHREAGEKRVWTIAFSLRPCRARVFRASCRLKPARDRDEITVLPVQGNVYLLAGAGANMAVQVGEDGVLLVDAGDGKATDKVIAAIRKLSAKPIRFILDTNANPDHMGGNERLAALGKARRWWPRERQRRSWRDGVRARVSAGGGERAHRPEVLDAGGRLAHRILSGIAKKCLFNNEAIQIFHAPAAHTDGDSLVFFRRSDVIVTGDIFVPPLFPSSTRAAASTA